MSQHEEWADRVVASMKRVKEAMVKPTEIEATRTLKTQPGADSGPNSTLAEGAAMAAVLANYMKNDNATTQALAIRVANLAAKYPKRAA